MRPIQGISRRLWALTQAVFLGKHRALEVLGNSCQWTIVKDSLNSKSLIYSAGVGHDISFEKELVAKYGCQIVLLDPSTTGTETMARPENNVSGIEFLPVGLAAEDGNLSFVKQLHPKQSGMTDAGTIQLPGTGFDKSGETIRFPVRSLESLMRERGHSHVSLLKLDIEGFEYSVIQSLLRNHLPIDQICVEFHEFMPGVGYWKNYKTLFALLAAGYRLVALKQHDHTFIKI